MRKKFNKLDGLIIVFVIVLIGIFVYKQTTDVYDTYKGDSDIEEMSTQEFTYMIEEVRDYTLDAIGIGDNFYEDTSGVYIGKVVKVWSEPYKRDLMTNDGRYVRAEVPEKSVVYMTLEGPILENESEYLASGTFELKMNSRTVLASNRVTFESKLAYFN